MEIEISIKLSLQEYEKLNWAGSEKDLTVPLKKELKKKKQNLSFQSYRILKKSIDARKKPNIFFTFRLAVQNINTKHLSKTPVSHSNIRQTSKENSLRPVVIGFGPAGIFAALSLSEAGLCPVIFERGRPIEKRILDVQKYFESGQVDEISNIQFGEGGAGTFSDGKLFSGVKDPRRMQVLETFVRFGADPNICYDAHPHIGTDKLQIIIPEIRKYIQSLGGTFHFSSQLIKIAVQDQKVNGFYWKDLDTGSDELQFLQTEKLILAIGHSARDTFRQLHQQGINIQKKLFSVGVRIEHLQSQIDQIQYGSAAGHPLLPPAEYKLVSHTEARKTLYTFCMCPGGHVVASASGKDEIVTNGMSYSRRNGLNANSAILVSVLDDDLTDNPLSGIDFQENLEKSAYVLGGKNGFAPCQRVEDFLMNRASSCHGDIIPTYLPDVRYTNIRSLFPKRISDTIACGLQDLNSRMPGFAGSDTLLTGVETRSSSPVRILRNECFNAAGVKGLFPIGEGAGYAGGIMSSAIDGIKCADFLLKTR